MFVTKRRGEAEEEDDVYYQRCATKMFVCFVLLAVTIEAEGWIDPQGRAVRTILGLRAEVSGRP